MAATFSTATDIILTERGLTIAGTRITLYDVMDYYLAQYPPKFIGSLFNLSETTIQDAIAYIEANRAAVDAEYYEVLQDAEHLEQHYRDRESEIKAKHSTTVPKPGTEALWEKLRSQQARHELDA
jgi:uncharacterized protein (DUF433 family)